MWLRAGLPLLLVATWALAQERPELPERTKGFRKTKKLELTHVWGGYEGKLVGPFNALAVSADGQQLVVAGRGLTLLHAGTGAEIRDLACDASLDCVAISPDRRRVLAGDGNAVSKGPIRVWDVESGATETFGRSGDEGPGVHAIAFSPDGTRALSGGSDGSVTLWDVSARSEVAALSGHDRAVRSVAFSPDGKTGFSGSFDGVKVWDLARKRMVKRLGTTSVASVAISPDGRLALAAQEKVLRLYDLTTGKEVRALEGHSVGVVSVAFSPDGKRAVSGGEDKTARLWDVETGKELRSLAHKSIVTAAAFSPDGARIFTTSERLRIFDASSGEEISLVRGHAARVTAVAVSPDGARVLSGSDDDTLRIWSTESAHELARIDGTSAVTDIAVAALESGTRALVARERGALEVVLVETGALVKTLDGHASPCVALLPGGKQALVGSAKDKAIALRDVESGEVLRTMTTSRSTAYADDVIGPQVTAVAVSPDGKRGLAAHYVGKVSVWDLESGAELGSFNGAEVVSIAFSPSGKRALGASGKFLRGWSLPKGDALWSIEDEGGPPRRLTRMAFSPDRELAVAGYGGRRVKLWGLERGEVLDAVDLSSSADEPTAFAFAPDGRSFVVGTQRGLVLRFAIAR